MAGGSSSAKRSRGNENENETADRPTKRPRYNYGDAISVLVGSEEQCFIVHRDVVCDSSKFFRAACSTRWKEGQEKIVRLPIVTPVVFDMYMDWIYFKDLASNKTYSRSGHLVNLYLLGDMVDDKNLRNKVMDALQNSTHERQKGLSPRRICQIWDNTTEGSTLRKWAFDMILLKQRGTFEENSTMYPPDFVRQIAVKLMQQPSNISSAAFLARSQEYQEADDDV